MKLIITMVFALAAMTFTLSAAQDTIKIQTTAQCEDCKERIEKAVNELEGIESADLEVESAVATVIFDTEKTSSEDIKKSIASVGYDADDVKKR